MIEEVIRRKAAAFWIEDTPRTTLRHLYHDTIPTGPPVRSPPHHLKGEEAEFVDKTLQAEVESGQLVRGNSEWASPPFCTKTAPSHRQQRKRRVVVDYRKVNGKTLRAIYLVRSADAIVQDVAGSAFLTLVDACKGFNQIVNTERASKMLAILARSGMFLPQCLPFGPHNGPEDYGFATDRVYSPGRNRKMRLCKEWQIYADDMTIRSGRVVDGKVYTDAEYAARVTDAFERQQVKLQPIEEAFRALGFDPASGNKTPKRRETAKEKAADGRSREAASDPSPYAHVIVICSFMLMWICVVCRALLNVSIRNRSSRVLFYAFCVPVLFGPAIRADPRLRSEATVS